jgi:hypothetical protein
VREEDLMREYDIDHKPTRLSLLEMYAELSKKIKQQEKFLLKINDIRNSIIGFQMISWSEHIYPLVATLNEAGVKGLHYPEAKKNNGTLKEKIKLLESQVAEQEKYAVHIYNSGYKAGHNDTVEGYYTDVFTCDMDTYHADVVKKLRAELLAGEK